MIVYQVKRPNVTSWLFRNWYALPYVAACYKEMALFIPVVRNSDADQWLADLDFRIWGAHPSVWLERVHTPVLTEFLQIVYTLFVPAVLYIAWRALAQTANRRFSILCFLNRTRLLASYLGYILVPARGPRFLLKHLQHFPLQGLWLFQTMQNTLDRLESAHYDCFPAGTQSSPSSPGGVAGWFPSGYPRSIWPTLRASFLLQFIFDTTIRLTCWPG